MTKKAIFIGPAYPYRGGIAAFNENLASTFQANGWECKIFTFIQQYPNFLFPGKNQLTTEDIAPNLSIKRAIYSTKPLNWLKITKEIVALEPDIIVTQYWMPFMAPAFGTILRGVKKALPQVCTITVVHNFKPHEGMIGAKQLGRYVANRTDILVSLSQKVASDISKTVPNKKVLSLFHPIYDHYGKPLLKDEARQKLGLDKQLTYFLFFGLIRSYKGLDMLIEALPRIKSNKSFKLIVAGEFYENEKKYDKLISSLVVSDRIILRNAYISNEEVPLYFCAADAVILPYKKATQSGVLPIALHFEIPIIMTKVGGLDELISRYNIGLSAEANSEDLAEKIELFLNATAKDKPDFHPVKEQLSWQSFYEAFISEIEHNAEKDHTTD